ncbi:hypothetical protein VOLCADRAFT_115660 [Volvox carteri f. nagariensis]|uniref:Uncharacterized protein n=1 Tax=Volvox carteri f. nagariensis TaxID=3068 RepID=D8THH1_VOLCA|nr:uncharacterized protein VOLCADRAFT_115660 [Volvox carteri f. nagariensis]EFJ52709.1 hypothetical protein VOLCADRAFT_115660 [Volvox carteri f. nagariensis]|eukprot:XP_002945714.1 hypothetical protein VOLCADRAFT_115660 [Volvox carteri f. nagariensis]
MDAPEAGQERPGSRQRASERAGELFSDFAQEDGTLAVTALGDLLSAVDVNSSPDTCMRVVNTLAGPHAESMTRDQALAAVGMISTTQESTPGEAHQQQQQQFTQQQFIPQQHASQPLPQSQQQMLGQAQGGQTGALHLDEAVVQYMAKLEEHRRKCEVEGRYQEAKLASRRLADLRTAQVDSLRQELACKQARELEEVHAVYEEETAKFHQLWDQRMKEYGANVTKALEDLKSSHTTQLAAYVEDLQRKKPTRARPSRDYLVQREMQDKLVKAKLYGRATKVKSMADELYQAELETTVAAWEAESKLKIAKLQSKQQNEYEVLLQRGAKGRDELELKRLAETERRTLRFRNIVSELEQLHKLELAHLENFLDAQVLAGKATPLKDPGAFRRKREQLFSLSLS